MKKGADGREIRTLISDGTRNNKGELHMKNRTLAIPGDPQKRCYAFVDDFADDGIAAAQLPDPSASGKKVWHIIDDRGRPLNPKGHIAREGNHGIVADDPAEALNRFRELRIENRHVRDNLKLEKARNSLYEKFPHLKSEKIHVLETDVDGVYRVQKEGPNGFLKGYVNIKHDKFVDPQFDDVFYSDAKHGFVRVKKDGKWGTIDVKTGEPIIDVNKNDFKSIQVSNERLGLFEVEVDVPSKSGSGYPERRLGLVSSSGKILIEPKYTYIENPREGLYRGVVHAEGDYSKVAAQSSYFDVNFGHAEEGLGQGAKGAGRDGLTRVVDTAIAANDARMK